MRRILSVLLAGSAICTVGLLSSSAQETKKAAAAKVAGGIVGHIKSVDKTKQTLTITTDKDKKRPIRSRPRPKCLGRAGARWIGV